MNPLRIMLFVGYILIVGLLFKLCCIIDTKIQEKAVIMDLNDTTLITITEDPE